jgi:CDGSH-type Zn-finger protein
MTGPGMIPLPGGRTGLPTDETFITLCPGGPMLVRGPFEIVDADGQAVPRNRATVAVCRCGKSTIAPYCDGTHKLIRSARNGSRDATSE